MTLPLLVLGGGDRKPHHLPPRGRDKHPLTGCKGADVLVGGRRLIDVVLERLTGLPEVFGPFYVAGPARVYREIAAATLIDTDADFGGNLEAGIERVRHDHPGSPIAVTTCDVLPDRDEILGMLAHYWAHAPCDLWFPLVRLPPDEGSLGESAWKPRYKVLDQNGTPARVLPGHLVIVEPEGMRLEFLYRLLQSAYDSRNHSMRYRRWYLLRRMTRSILAHDWRELAGGRLPTMTLDVLAAVRAARRLIRGTLPEADLECNLRRVFVHRAHRLAYPERRMLLPILEGLSLARDIDTVEEAKALGAVALPVDSVPAH
jgi:hypothetical protein